MAWFFARSGFIRFSEMKSRAYAQAGVDIDLGNKVKATLPQMLASTHRPEVLGKVVGIRSPSGENSYVLTDDDLLAGLGWWMKT